MAFFYTDDPVADAENYAAEQDRQLENYPRCEYCGHEIQDEKLFDIDGELYHISCFKEQFQKDTEDYVA